MEISYTSYKTTLHPKDRLKEKNFEQDIETCLLNEGGYVKGDQSTYDKKRAIDMSVLLQFIQATQPKVWQRYVNLYGEKSSDQLYKVFQQDVANYGLVHVLRNGIKDRGVAIRFWGVDPLAKDNRGVLRDRVSIDRRPTVVDQKIRFGDLEIDTIVGSNHKGAILTINDRLTSFCWIELLKGRNAKELADAAVRRLLPVKEHIRTITSDNGKEFAEHKSIAEKLGVDFFFAHPYHSWERGANENTNGLIRQYIPKGSSFENLTDDRIRLIERKLNNRPREKLGFLTPNEKPFFYFCSDKLIF